MAILQTHDNAVACSKRKKTLKHSLLLRYVIALTIYAVSGRSERSLQTMQHIIDDIEKHNNT